MVLNVLDSHEQTGHLCKLIALEQEGSCNAQHLKRPIGQGASKQSAEEAARSLQWKRYYLRASGDEASQNRYFGAARVLFPGLCLAMQSNEELDYP
jgi:hypothetical protein